MIGIKYGKRKVVKYRGNQMVVGGLTSKNKIDILLYITTELANCSKQEELFNNVLSLGAEIFEADNITLRILKNGVLEPVVFLKETDPPRRPLNPGEGFSGKVAEDKKSLLMENVPEEDPDLLDQGESTACICCAPVLYKDNLLGTISIEKETPYFFKTDDLEILEAMASQLGLALNEVRLIEGLIEAQNRINSDLRLGRTVQSQIIETEIAPWNCLHFAQYYEPMVEVSGDYFDVVRNGDTLTALIADVSGHGVSAALITMSIHHEFRRCTDLGLGLSEIVEQMANTIMPRLPSGTYFTAQLVRIYNDYTYSYVSAGHNELLHYQALSGTIVRGTNAGVPLGIVETRRQDYPESFGSLQPGDFLIMHTDGFTEQRNAAEETVGLAQFVQWIQDTALEIRQSSALTLKDPAQAALQALLNRWEQFTGTVPREDDLTMLMIGMSDRQPEARRLYQQATQAWSKRDLDAARKWAMQCLQVDSSLHGNLYLLARLLYKTGEYNESARYMESYIEDSGEKTAHSYYLLGSIYFRLGNMNEARLSLKRALVLDHTNEDAVIMLARTYLRLQEKVKALRTLEKSAKAIPASTKIRAAIEKLQG
ncbi:MAG: SpoIIE family protein phosphatase [Leptospiraceae bacterium]|nr:SpoIIE family protein phosphatase [Leptospiraceae bacterium]